MATLNLYVNWFTKKLMQSQRNGAEFVLPFFSEGDVVPMKIKILEPDADNQFTYASPDISSLAVSLTVETSTGGTPFVAQYTWTKDTSANTFSANVDFGTSDLNTWLSTSSSKQGLLKIRLAEGATTTTIIEQLITIRQNASGASPATPTPGHRTLTFEEAEQVFAKKMMGPGETLTFRSADGTAGRTLGVYKDGTSVLSQDDLYSI